MYITLYITRRESQKFRSHAAYNCPEGLAILQRPSERRPLMASLYQRPGYSLYYIQHRVAGRLLRESTDTEVLQIAKEKLRQFESAQARGLPSVLPTKTPVAEILTAYVEFIRAAKTPKSAQTDIYYLRDVFGADACEVLKVTSRKISAAVKKRPLKPGQDRRRTASVIRVNNFEDVTTAMISSFITGRMANRGLAPKTGNRIRDTLSSLFSWANSQRNIRMPGEKNPAAAVKKYSESAPEIRFLTLRQVNDQLAALNGCLHLQTMAAVLIFAGLRREELLQLRHDDIDLETGNFGLIRVRAKTVSDQAWQPKTKRNRGVSSPQS